MISIGYRLLSYLEIEVGGIFTETACVTPDYNSLKTYLEMPLVFLLPLPDLGGVGGKVLVLEFLPLDDRTTRLRLGCASTSWVLETPVSLPFC